MNIKQKIFSITFTLLALLVISPSVTHAATPQRRKGVAGTVISVNKGTITLKDSSNRLFQITTDEAVFDSGNSNISFDITDVLPNDLITARGNFNQGASKFAATKILDMTFIQRNVFAGTVANIIGSTIILTNVLNQRYIVDASAATITQGIGTQTSSLDISDISTGDFVTAIGTLSGSSVTAGFVNDRAPMGGGLGIRTGGGGINPRI